MTLTASKSVWQLGQREPFLESKSAALFRKYKTCQNTLRGYHILRMPYPCPLTAIFRNQRLVDALTGKVRAGRPGVWLLDQNVVLPLGECSLEDC